MENIEKVEGVRILRQIIVAPTMRPDGSRRPLASSTTSRS